MRDSCETKLRGQTRMRRMTFALGAIVLALTAVVPPAVAATEPAQETVSANEPAAPVRKRQVRKKTGSSSQAGQRTRCKAGEKWDATASVSAGACVKRGAKTKVKTVKKSADQPAQRPLKKKVG